MLDEILFTSSAAFDEISDQRKKNAEKKANNIDLKIQSGQGGKRAATGFQNSFS